MLMAGFWGLRKLVDLFTSWRTGDLAVVFCFLVSVGAGGVSRSVTSPSEFTLAVHTLYGRCPVDMYTGWAPALAAWVLATTPTLCPLFCSITALRQR